MQHGLARRDLAQLLAVPGSTVDGWRRAGAPTMTGRRFDVAAVVGWLVARAAADQERPAAEIDSDQALGRWRLARAAREELALARDRAELHSLADCQADVGRILTELRLACFALPDQLARRLARQEPEQIRVEIDAALRFAFEQAIERLQRVMAADTGDAEQPGQVAAAPQNGSAAP